jgi:hypothetical protein
MKFAIIQRKTPLPFLAVPRKFTATVFLGMLAMFPESAIAAHHQAQNSPADVAIVGAKVYTLAGAPMEGATVLMHGGKIAAVGSSIQIPAGAQVIDAKGLEVYPGLFDPITQIGLQEISSVRGTVDISSGAGGGQRGEPCERAY